MMRDFRLMVQTLPGLHDPSLAIAASRAGELGVLNLEHIRDEAVARAAIAKMAKYAKTVCGIKLDSSNEAFIAHITADLPRLVGLVVLTSTDLQRLDAQVRMLQRRNLTVLLESTSVDQARRGQQAGVDGLIAKGHEAGGWVGEETTFILLQQLLSDPGLRDTSGQALPVWAHGGIGHHTAAAAYAAGAAGVVLDAQLALTRESSLPDSVKEAIARMDGSETVVLGRELGAACRMYTRPGLAVVDALRDRVLELRRETQYNARDRRQIWFETVQEHIGWDSPEQQIWLLGQDAAFAASLAHQVHTVGGVLAGLRRAVDEHVETASQLQPLGEASPLAQSHHTRYPIVQGPMTRVSDRAEFALQVAEGGALPFLALALMRGPEVEALLRETQALLGDRPWGVGILGFVPLDLRQEQLAVIQRYRPPFALIAGGRPDQAKALEEDGVHTYLHVPSPGLLRLFLQDGARRFVFEGRECGGHVGPRSSFVLWNTMIDMLLEELPADDAESCHVLFAGGIHDALSSSMVATMAAPLAERGVKIGVLLGTSYLFTEEAVSSGAILPGFQEEAINCDHTVLVESGPGHAVRCVENRFAEEFEQEKLRLLQEGKSAEEIRLALEHLNIGRLRIASKGIDRHPGYGQDPGAPKFITVDEEEQHRQGMYMIGQLAALRNRVCSISELHHEVSVAGSQRLASVAPAVPAAYGTLPAAQPSEIAIVGISCILPKAGDLQTYWENILHKVNAITEIPKERWDWKLYYDPDRRARDKIYSKWGGFIDEVPFDPLEFGMPPNSLPSIDPMQMLALVAARAALQDADYWDRPFDRSRASVILGASGGVADLGALYCMRSELPLLFGDASRKIIDRADGILPEWTEDSFAGLLLNVAAGRIANRLDLGGLNYVVDAACASSLTAVHLAVKELETYNTDLVIAGGVDTVQTPFGYLCFSKTQALSPTGQSRTFDATADGIAISEGVVMLVLKRLADAERDGDRIYAVIQGVGASSDGRAMGLTAPRPEGQVLALQRAYAKAGFSPTTVGLFEAHGTGTVVGDRTEALSLTRFLEEARAEPQSHALGSIKSMIGHTKATAGVAGLAKVALALYHKVLPPTLGVTEPNPEARLDSGPLYVNSEARPWIQDTQAHPRRAGVSAFGFGGTNFHAVVEEYTGDFLPQHPAALQRWPSELFLWRARSREELLTAVSSLEQDLQQGAQPELRDLSYTVYKTFNPQPLDRPRTPGSTGHISLAVIATSLDDLRQKLAQVRQALDTTAPASIQDPRGIYLAEVSPLEGDAVAFLFPGQGSQYPNMLRDLALQFSEVREAFERGDHALARQLPRPLSRYVFPPPAFTPDAGQEQQAALTQTNIAQPALGVADMALFRLLQSLGVQPDMVAGHSYGEYVALCAAGVFDEETLAVISELRGRSIVEAATQDLGTMAAVSASPDQVAEVVGSMDGVWLANLNAPEQTIISGTQEGVEQAVARLTAQGIRARSIPVACAFHSPLVAPAQERLARALSDIEFKVPELAVFSNTTGVPYPEDPNRIAGLLADHLVKPVRFVNEILAMYEAGARVFVEVGPRNVLTNLTRQILGDRPHGVVAVDVPGRSGLRQLQHALGQLAVHGVPVQLERFFCDRRVRRLNLDALVEDTAPEPLSPTTWLVSGSRARPQNLPAVPPQPPLASLRLEPADSNGAIKEPIQSVESTSESPPKSRGANGQSPVGPVEDGRRSAASGTHAASSVPAGRSDAHSGGNLPAVAAQRPPAVHPGTARVSPAGDESGPVMLQFQQLMGRFLETQKNVMLAYLQGTPGQSTPTSGMSIQSRPPDPMVAPPPARGPSQGEVQPPPSDAPPGEEPPEPVQTFQDVEAEAAHEIVGDAAVVAPDVELLPDRDHLTQKLLEIVGERTGYPPDMLDLDVDMEADLGIDSIKRVEILGALQQVCIPDHHQLSPEAMEHLTALKTLNGVIDWLDAALRLDGLDGRTPAAIEGPEGKVGAQPEPPAALQTTDDVRADVPRAVLVAVDAPVADFQPLRLSEQPLFLVTDDGRGVAEAVTDGVRDSGGRVALVQLADGTLQIEQDIYQADLTDAGAVEDIVAQIRRQHGPIGGVIHLLPLSEGAAFEKLDLASWQTRLRREVKSLFYLSKAVAQDLKQAGEAEGAWLVAATAMGGACAVDTSADETFFPGQAGIAGLVKTLAREWPAVQCKVIDLDPGNQPSVLAEQLLQELALADGPVEVGYRGARRQVLQLRPAPLDLNGPAHLLVESDWVILVTGGARGITAEVACELAEQYQPTLLLVGRSPLPAPEEPEATAGLDSPPALKAALIQQMRQAGERSERVTVAQVEAAYNRLLKEREIRANLARMQQAGARVRYYQADVRDESAIQAVIEDVYRVYGRLDGVIHGAGIIEDKLIEDKTPDSFDRVFDTKADSAFILSRALRSDSLKFLALFSSAAGRFGNRGQCDYAATNEVVNKLAVYLNQRWPGRVFSINWGPWAKRGMVSPALQREFDRRGIELIPLPAGRRWFDCELRYGRKAEAEVTIAGGTWGSADVKQGSVGVGGQTPKDAVAVGHGRDAVFMPLLQQTTVSNGPGGHVEAVRILDPSFDVYLRDHRLDGKPVLPAAVAVEHLAEIAQQGWPDLQVAGIRDLRVLRGVVLEDGPKPFRLVARALADPPHDRLGVDVSVEMRDRDGDGHPYYRGIVELAKRLPEPTPDLGPTPDDLRPFPMSLPDAYREWLFHGPLFQRLTRISGISEHWVVATCMPCPPWECLAGDLQADWLIDPIVFDCGLQLIVLWTRLHHNMTPLPAGFRTFRRFGPFSGSEIRCYLRAHLSSDGHRVIGDLYFLDAGGRLQGVFEGLETTGSQALNRLGGSHLREYR